MVMEEINDMYFGDNIYHLPKEFMKKYHDRKNEICYID